MPMPTKDNFVVEPKDLVQFFGYAELDDQESWRNFAEIVIQEKYEIALEQYHKVMQAKVSAGDDDAETRQYIATEYASGVAWLNLLETRERSVWEQQTRNYLLSGKLEGK